jgi:hypothetical protein
VVEPGDVQAGGALARLGSHVVGLTGAGALYRLEGTAAAGVRGVRLPLPSPLDRAAFAAEALPLANREWFRAHGVIGRAVPDGWQVFVSHQVWSGSGRCVATTVSSARLDTALERAIEGGSAVNYSTALRQVGGRWTEARLEAFLADPGAFAPGTAMTYRVESAEDRRALVAFLRRRR